jgi:hypothetical protein
VNSGAAPEWFVGVEAGACAMKIVMLGLVGLLLGAIAGGVIGVILGMIWTNVFQTSSFEGYSGMLVFYSFMPIGIMLGALIGAAGLGYLAARDAS